MTEKNKFKASGYLADISQKDKLLKEARFKCLDQEEEMKKLNLTREKFRMERNALMAEMK